MESFQDRMWHWRNKHAEMTLQELTDAVNALLEEERQVSLSTVATFEARDPDQRSSEPRAYWLYALQRAFPDLNLDWLITGDGSPTRSAERAEEAANPVETMVPDSTDPLMEEAGHIARKGGQVAWSAFTEALFRLMQSVHAPGEGEEFHAGMREEQPWTPGQVAELGGALAEVVHEPLRRVSRGTFPSLNRRAYVEYYLGVLTSIMRVMPGRRKSGSLEKTLERLKGENHDEQ